ncbi:MAG: PadR family transcriptional regulator [Thermoleophilia bacterium]|nr:PadR family transcriptional regulator [Thermoleophilia bacterium]
MNCIDDVLAGHAQELRRGSVVLACLSVLREPRYGYALLDLLKEAGIEVDGNTLYPLLRRLERQGLLTSAWNTDDARPRKYYSVSPSGERVRERLAAEWAALDGSIRALLKEKGA